MKKILDCFDYLKRYQVDILESIYIFLEFFLLKHHNRIKPLLEKASKRKRIYEDFCISVKKLLPDFIAPNPKLNLCKILKLVDDVPIESLGEFFDTITQKKTNHKLYFYATPIEISTLLVELLDLKDGETLYNPCFGLGSLFLEIHSKVLLFGEELDERFIKIAKLLCLLKDFQRISLVSNDILKSSSFKTSKGFYRFDKIICNPPLQTHMGTHYIKEDERFSGILSKNYPELIFLFHSLVHLKIKGVFILRSQIFKNSLLEQKLKHALQNRLECIIDLPKNIFPYQNHDFCIIVVKERHTEGILHIDATKDTFYLKEGRYNRLNQIQSLLHLYHSKAPSPHSKLLSSIDKLFCRTPTQNHPHTLGDFAHLFRGQRVYGERKNTPITYYEVGINDFTPLGFSQEFENLRSFGNAEKIKKYALKPYDILISLRGSSPKITILSDSIPPCCVANTGIVVLRFKNKQEALAIYAYLFCTEGEKALQTLCNPNLVPSKLKELPIPKDYEKYSTMLPSIHQLANQLKSVQEEIQNLKGNLCQS